MKYWILVVWALVVVACGPGSSTSVDGFTEFRTASPGIPDVAPDPDLLRAELAEARARWAAVDRPWYRYWYEGSCECDHTGLGPNKVVVVNGVVTQVLYEGPFDVEKPLFLDPGQVATVEELFDLVEASINRGVNNDVSYFDTGMPKKVYLDLEGIAADGGYAIEIVEREDALLLRASLKDAYEVWIASDVESYTAVYSWANLCPEPTVEMHVIGGDISDAQGSECALSSGVLTINAMFDSIDRRLGIDPGPHATLEFDENGVPTDVWIPGPPGTADGQWAFRLIEFTVIRSAP